MTDFRHIYEETSDEKPVLQGLRAFGPTFIAATGIIPKPLDSFWNTGIVGKTDSTTPPPGYFVNPLFVYSTVGHDQCAIHSDTDPTLAFHCASALVDIKSDATEYCGLYLDSLTDNQKLSRFVKTEKLQFKSWCSTFREVILSMSTKLVICYYTGDALQLCYALQRHIGLPQNNIHEQITAPWNPPIAFDKTAQLELHGLFDVIDATNLTGSAPVHTVLISTIPLLQSSADATIFTSKFQCSKANFDPHSVLKSQWFCDPIVMFTLFGFAPTEYVTGVYHKSHLLEKFSDVTESDEGDTEIKTLWRFSWKRVLSGDLFAFELDYIPQPIWDADSLAIILHEIYNSMFAAEDPDSLLRALRNHEQPQQMSGCTRGSFVAFLQYLTLHFKTEWPSVFSKLSELVSRRYIMNIGALPHVLDFHFHLHERSLLSSPSFKPNVQSVLPRIPPSWRSVLGDAPLPDAMSFILRIPRAKLGSFIEYLNDFKGNPHEAVIEVNIKSGEEFSIFSSFEMAFGTLLKADNLKDREIRVDNKGWNGNGDLFIFIRLPLAELFKKPTTTITVTVEYNSAFAEGPSCHLSQFGSEMIVFETRISNDLYFWPVANTKPHYQLQPSATATDTISGNKNDKVFANPKIFISPESRHLKIFFRIDLQNERDRKELESGAHVNFRVVSLCAIEVKCGTWKGHLISPFAIEESTINTKISRRLGCIELTGELKFRDNQADLNFHTLRHDGKSISWSLPRLNIDILPSLNLSTSNDLNWIRGCLKSMFSAREEGLWMKNSKADPMIAFKGSLFTLISAAVGWPENDTRIRTKPNKSVVFIAQGRTSNISIILFITGIKLNSPSDSIVVDAHILPLRDEVIKILEPELKKITTGASTILCQEGEYKFWKCYLEATMEQSRNWSHNEKCNESIRLKPHPEESGICRCGEGQVSSDFRAIKQWEKFIPYVTRCPLTPIFATPYAEAMVSVKSIGNQFADLGISNSAACLMCHKRDIVRLKKCARCEIAQYCSKECQKGDWKRHKKECGKQRR